MIEMTFLEFMDALVAEDQENVEDYEHFHEDRLADIRKLAPMDAFLYGIATGKLDRSIFIRDLVKELMDQFGD
jgi:hypothetical protein